MSTILLLGNYRPTLTLARELGGLGYRIQVTRGGGEGLTEYSRFVSGVWDEPDPEKDEKAFTSALAAHLRENADIGIVLPVTESYVLALARNFDAMPPDRVYATPAPDLVLKTNDKPRMLSEAVALGVAVAPFRLVTSMQDLEGSVASIGCPVVVRPVNSALRFGTEKVVTLRSPSDLATKFPAWPAGHEELLVQRRMAGRRHNLYFAAARGRIVRIVHAVIGLTDRTDGSGLATEGQTVDPDPILVAYTEALIAGLHYHGIGCAQFLVDDDSGAISFLEINARIAGNHAVPEAAGLELGPLAVELAANPNADVALKQGRTGLRYSWTYGALRALKLGLARGTVPLASAPREVARIIRTCLTSHVHMTWSWRDPAPTLALFYQQFAPEPLKLKRATPAEKGSPQSRARALSEMRADA